MISLEDFKSLCEAMQTQRELVDDFKAELSEHQKRLDRMKNQIIEYLDAHELSKFSTDQFTISKVEKLNVKIKDKFKFFEYLKANNVFEALAGINSQTLNSWYRSELSNAITTGVDNFEIPGLEESSTHITLSLRKTK